MEKVVVEQKVVVYLSELREGAQSGRQHFDVLQGHPVLVELLVHPIHVRYDALALHRLTLTLALS
jgi:hypothetical protein